MSLGCFLRALSLETSPFATSSFLKGVAAIGLLLYGSLALSAEVALEWDPVSDIRVAYYEVHWGTESGVYQHSLAASETTTTVSGLEDGKTYYFAARACSADGATCSAFSNELSETLAATQTPATLDADFTASVTSGTAPLTVHFANASEGTVDSCEWSFGDGSTATGCEAVKTFANPGTFDVALTVQGPGGTATLAKGELITANTPSSGVDPGDPIVTPPGGDPSILGGDDLAIEIGEVSIDHNRHYVQFTKSFTDPIVVANPLSTNGGQPAVVRIDSIDANGFWIRVQEWEYLDGYHAKETVSYIVMERGRHELPNGTWIEADEVSLSETDGLYRQSFTAPFVAPPVVIASVASNEDGVAVTTRLHNVTFDAFRVALQEQEANRDVRAHAQEIVSYIAWEPSIGSVGALDFEVAQAPDPVTHAKSRLVFADTHESAPVVLVDMQTRNGADTAALRRSSKDGSSMEIWVDEEQSRDSETAHIGEQVGYILLNASGS